MNSLRILFVSTALFAALPAVAQDAAELLLRIDRLEADNRRLNGQVEQLGNQVRRLDDQLKRFQSDVDFRFKEGGGKGAQPAHPLPAPTTTPGRRSDAFDPAANPSAPGAPRTIGQVAAEAAATPLAGNAPTPLPGTAKGDYDTAQAMLDRGEFEAAEMAFREFIKAHGKDKLKPDAMFGLGESFYRRNRFREAAEQYLSVTTDFAKSGRAPEAMLKLGMSLRGLGAVPEACGTYGEVTKKYPKASPSIRQAVEREKKRAQCAA
ncbi:MAG: tol-pal system protein YbgF [Proteobacteria bacterium]|nr:tol-pal system protein YbgF [Pseudomonadota bacterium]